MSDLMVINVPAYEGEYEFDLAAQPLTTLEWRWIKKISGYLPLTTQEGFAGADPDLFVAWAVIAMVRAGKVPEAEVMEAADDLARAPFDGTAITFKGGDEPVEEVDPLGEPSTAAETPSTGESGNANGEPSPENVSPLRSGFPVSVTTSGSGQPTSETSLPAS